MSFKNRIAILSALTVFLAFAPTGSLRAAEGTQATPAQTVNDGITQKIVQSIADDPTLSANAKSVKVVTVDGSVTLRGKVNTVDERRIVEEKARAAIGVTRVVNQLEIYPQ